MPLLLDDNENGSVDDALRAAESASLPSRELSLEFLLDGGDLLRLLKKEVLNSPFSGPLECGLDAMLVTF